MDSNKELHERINKREVYRYLGYHGQIPDEDLCMMIDAVLDELIKVVVPKNIYKYYYCKVTEEKIYLWEEDKDMHAPCDIMFESRNLAANLSGCHRCVLLASTLGIEAEKLLYRYEIVNITKASIAQACGAACIEAYCNIISDEILANNPGIYLRPRFSPGYGDLNLDNQRKFFDNLECTKRLGLTLMDSMLMYPTKSVTAIIGLTEDKDSCHVNGCNKCNKKDCEFRYED